MKLPLILLLTLLTSPSTYAAEDTEDEEEICFPIAEGDLKECNCENIIDYLLNPKDDPGFTQNGYTFYELAIDRFSTGDCKRFYDPDNLLNLLEKIHENKQINGSPG